MKSLIQGSLTGTRGQARILAPRQVIPPRFSPHLNTPREISPFWGQITHRSVQVSDTLNPHMLLFPGMRDCHPGPERTWRSGLRGTRRLAGPASGTVGKVPTVGARALAVVLGNVPRHLRSGSDKPGEGRLGTSAGPSFGRHGHVP